MCATSSYLKMSGSTVKILLLQEDTYLLFRSRKYGSRVTKPYLLAHYVADLVLQLCQQRQFLIQVAFCVLELMASYKSPAGCWMSSSHAELLSQTQISPQEDGTPPAYWHFSTCMSALHPAHVLHCFPPIIPHWSSLVSSKDSLQVCKFYCLSFSFRSTWPKNGPSFHLSMHVRPVSKLRFQFDFLQLWVNTLYFWL